MPWQNQGGGGGGGGGWPGGGGGPWGQGPASGGGQGPRGPQQSPDLEEIIRRGQEKLRSILPGSGRTGRGGWAALAVVAGLFWAYQCAYTIQPDELGVVLHFGKYDRTTPPGLNFILWPVETVETPKALKENILTFGIGGDSTSPDAEGLMLAGDQNIVDIEFSVLWKISDPRAYLFNVRDPEQLLRVVAESALREYAGRSKAEEIRTKGREAAQEAVQALIQDVLNSYNAGIVITGVQLNKAEPPGPVMDAFAEVNRAQQDSAKFVNEANQYAFRRSGQANGEAAKIREDANAYKGRVIAEAEGEAQRFTSIYEQYKVAKDVTRKRLYLEMMEKVMSGSRKVIVEQGAGNGVLPYLPVGNPPAATTAPASSATTSTSGGQQ